MKHLWTNLPIASSESLHMRRRLTLVSYTILVIELPIVESLNWLMPSTVFLAAIKTCILNVFDSLGNHYYSKLRPLEVIDANCIQCAVGRVRAGKLWTIIDRSNHVDSICDVDYVEDE
jgi:hypothetical protein